MLIEWQSFPFGLLKYLILCGIIIINEFAQINSQTIYQEAAAGKKHEGPYKQAMTRKKNGLEKSIHNHTEQVLKIENPLSEASDWNTLVIEENIGCIAKWIKDMVRNAEQALIEIEIWRKRYEHSDDEN